MVNEFVLLITEQTINNYKHKVHAGVRYLLPKEPIALVQAGYCVQYATDRLGAFTKR
jgi:hypothetical protein